MKDPKVTELVKKFQKQLKDINMLPADFNPHDSYDTSFKKGCFN